MIMFFFTKRQRRPLLEEDPAESIEAKEMLVMGYVTGAVTPFIAYDVWANHYMLTSMASSIGFMAMAGALVGMIQTGLLKDCSKEALGSAVWCLLALLITAKLNWIIKKLLERYPVHLDILMRHFRIRDFKFDIENAYIYNLDSAFHFAAKKGKLSSANIEVFIAAVISFCQERETVQLKPARFYPPVSRGICCRVKQGSLQS